MRTLRAPLRIARHLLHATALLPCLAMVLWTTPAKADSEQPYFTPGGPVDQPGFTGATLDGNRLTFHFNGITDWQSFHVRYNGKQFDNHSGNFTLNGVRPNHIYKISVQGVHKHPFGKDDCSRWTECIWVVH